MTEECQSIGCERGGRESQLLSSTTRGNVLLAVEPEMQEETLTESWLDSEGGGGIGWRRGDCAAL